MHIRRSASADQPQRSAGCAEVARVRTQRVLPGHRLAELARVLVADVDSLRGQRHEVLLRAGRGGLVIGSGTLTAERGEQFLIDRRHRPQRISCSWAGSSARTSRMAAGAVIVWTNGTGNDGLVVA